MKPFPFLLRMCVGSGLLAVAACGDDGGSGEGADGTSESSSEATGSPTTTPETSTSEASSGGSSSGGSSDSGSSESAASSCDVEVPEAWEAPDWDKNTATALALRAQLDALVAYSRAVEQGTETIEEIGDLTELFRDGDPSVADITTEGYLPVITDVFEEFVELALVGEADLIDEDGLWDPGEAGGIFGASDRGINEGGVEVRQLIDKGLFGGGAFYAYAVGLTAGEIDEATIDSIAALFGGNAEFDPDSKEFPRTDSANYVYQMGYYGAVAEALTAAKAYAADEACTAERDEALVAAFRAWEIGVVARFVYYAYAGAVGVELATTDDDFAGALHGPAEGIGLLSGFYGLEAPESGPLADAPRLSSDEQILDIFEAIRVDLEDLGNSQMGTFVENSNDFFDAVDELEEVVAEIFGLDPAEVAAWHETSPG